MNTSDPWTSYTRAQKLANSSMISDRYWAADDAADVELDRIERGEMIADSATANLHSNRGAKYRRRRELLRRQVLTFYPQATNDNDRHEAWSELRQSAGRCRPAEWLILVMVGLGYTYREIGVRLEIPSGTAKTLAHRGRLRLAA